MPITARKTLGLLAASSPRGNANHLYQATILVEEGCPGLSSILDPVLSKAVCNGTLSKPELGRK